MCDNFFCIVRVYYGYSVVLIDISLYKFNYFGEKGKKDYIYVVFIFDFYRGKF